MAHRINNKTIGKDELVHQVASKTGQTLKEATDSIDALMDVITSNLAGGNDVRMMGFGTWSLKHVEGRRVKSIRNGESIIIPAKTRVSFSIGAVLAKAAQRYKRPVVAREQKTRSLR